MSTTTIPAPASMTIHEAMKHLGCGKSKIFELLRYGHLVRAARDGRGTRVTVKSVVERERRKPVPSPGVALPPPSKRSRHFSPPDFAAIRPTE